MTKEKFAAAINCIDGRVQAPVADWIKFHHQIHYVDMITEPGVDKIISEEKDDLLESIAKKLMVSIKAHGSNMVAVCGHFDCAANPTSLDEQKDQIKDSAEIIVSWNFGVRVLGLYVNEWNSVDLLFDSDENTKSLKSFL